MLMPNALALIGVQILDLTFDVIDLAELLQRELSKWVLKRRCPNYVLQCG
jgi:hypothetical protein